MSLLHPESAILEDSAAKGEDYTKGSSHVVWASLTATVLVSVAIGLYIWAGQKPPLATGNVEQVWAHPMHTETSGFDAAGAPMPKQSFDQVLVFGRVKLHNQSSKPLFLHQIMTNVTLDDGVHTSYAASPSDFDRVFVAYPELSPLHGNSMPSEATVAPGQTLEGTFVSAFRMDKQQWDSRKSLNFTFAFEYQPSLVLSPQSAVIEQ
jgi:hypothetical protein